MVGPLPEGEGEEWRAVSQREREREQGVGRSRREREVFRMGEGAAVAVFGVALPSDGLKAAR